MRALSACDRTAANGQEKQLKQFLRSRGIAVVVGTLMLTLGSGNAAAQSAQVPNIEYSLSAGAVDSSARPLGSGATAPVVDAVQRTIVSTSSMLSKAVGAVFGARPVAAQDPVAALAREATWLQRSGWPLYALVDKYSSGFNLDEQATCMATAVYFEARGEAIEGQLAVADVVMNRASSGKYPPSWCEVVKQPWQFSFVRHGEFPTIDYDSDAWRKAQGVTRLAIANVARSVPSDVLWYHADYVAPSWGKRLSYVNKIGAHIFYRA